MRPEKPRNGPTQARPASDTTLRSRGAGNARSCASTIAVLKAGRRESRVPMTPAVVRTGCTRRTAGAPEHPAFPAQWFYGLCRDLLGAEFLWRPSLTDWRSIEVPVGPDNLHQLDTSNGCQDHTVLPSAASSDHTLQPARMLPEEVSTEAFKRRSSSRRPIAHGKPPCDHARGPTLPRPPQPVPTFVTNANALSVGQNSGSCRFDLGDALSEKSVARAK